MRMYVKGKRTVESPERKPFITVSSKEIYLKRVSKPAVAVVMYFIVMIFGIIQFFQ